MQSCLFYFFFMPRNPDFAAQRTSVSRGRRLVGSWLAPRYGRSYDQTWQKLVAGVKRNKAREGGSRHALVFPLFGRNAALRLSVTAERISSRASSLNQICSALHGPSRSASESTAPPNQKETQLVYLHKVVAAQKLRWNRCCCRNHWWKHRLNSTWSFPKEDSDSDWTWKKWVFWNGWQEHLNTAEVWRFSKLPKKNNNFKCFCF